MRVVAICTNACQVIIESSSRSPLNLFNIGANSRNVTQLSDFIRNEVYRISNTDEDIHLKPNDIRLRNNDIKFRGG